MSLKDFCSLLLTLWAVGLFILYCQISRLVPLNFRTVVGNYYLGYLRVLGPW